VYPLASRRKNSVLSSDWIGLTVEGQEKTVRRRSSSRVPPNSSVSREHPKPPLIKAVARAHGWYERWFRASIDMRSLARDAGLNRPLRFVRSSAALSLPPISLRRSSRRQLGT